MTPREIVAKWIETEWFSHDPAIRNEEEAIVAGLVIDIEEAIRAAVEEKDKRIAELESALAVFEDGANWEVYPGLREPTEYIWRHDSDPRVLAQDACNNEGTK